MEEGLKYCTAAAPLLQRGQQDWRHNLRKDCGAAYQGAGANKPHLKHRRLVPDRSQMMINEIVLCI